MTAHNQRISATFIHTYTIHCALYMTTHQKGFSATFINTYFIHKCTCVVLAMADPTNVQKPLSKCCSD
jgi:hypothetical protein